MQIYLSLVFRGLSFDKHTFYTMYTASNVKTISSLLHLKTRLGTRLCLETKLSIKKVIVLNLHST